MECQVHYKKYHKDCATLHDATGGEGAESDIATQVGIYLTLNSLAPNISYSEHYSRI